MTKANSWTNEEIKELKKAVKKEGGIAAGCRVFAEKSGVRSEGASVVKWYALTQPKKAKRKWSGVKKAETQPERVKASKGLTFDIQNIKRAVLNGDNSLTLFF